MSLINDALKKAAKQRAQEQANVVAPMPGGGGRGYPESRPKSMQTMVLIGAGAVALIVVSVMITGMMLTRTPETKPATTVVAPAAVQTSTPAAAPQAAAVKIEAPTISLAQAAPAPRIVVAPALPKPTPAPMEVAVVRTEPTHVAPPTPAPVATPSAQASQAQTDAIQATVDAFLVSGVRAAGNDSKALVNGHVYKVNDQVDRALGLKLVKVEQDKLTFVDRTGAIFVKTF
jgi:hypothetical protein